MHGPLLIAPKSKALSNYFAPATSRRVTGTTNAFLGQRFWAARRCGNLSKGYSRDRTSSRKPHQSWHSRTHARITQCNRVRCGGPSASAWSSALFGAVEPTSGGSHKSTDERTQQHHATVRVNPSCVSPHQGGTRSNRCIRLSRRESKRRGRLPLPSLRRSEQRVNDRHVRDRVLQPHWHGPQTAYRFGESISLQRVLIHGWKLDGLDAAA